MRFNTRTVLVHACLLLVSGPVFAQSPDFSGTYRSDPIDKHKPEGAVTLTLTQTSDLLTITHTADGKSTTNTMTLNGAPGSFTTETGAQGKGWAKWKGSELIIETLVAAPTAGGASMRLHTTERYRLSKDGKALKVHEEIDSPDMPAAITAAAFQPFDTLYHRVSP